MSKSLFYPPELIERAKRNAEQNEWAREARDGIVKTAQPWMSFSDDELWDMMFGCTITRSWMVWSNGHCPACKESVPMYNWKIDALKHPWKLRCPQCEEFFPKNDFHAFYRSGLDEHGVFQHDLANRSLLFNEEHPDPDDPLHSFGVDDGHGYREGENIWRYVGTYLVYGQWKQASDGLGSGASFVETGQGVEPLSAGDVYFFLEGDAASCETGNLPELGCIRVQCGALWERNATFQLLKNIELR